MNAALILAGGTGSRMGMDRPKQYLSVCGRPVIDWSLRTFQGHEEIDGIVIVAAKPWHGMIDCLLRDSGIAKFSGYAEPGESRQLSVFSGLRRIRELLPATEKVIIHDAARPLLTAQLITVCLDGLSEADAVIPVLPIKDTCYQSEDGRRISGFLPRSQLFAGQAPEAFRFQPYFDIHERMNTEELSRITGSGELAYKNGMSVLLVEGDERNLKITTRNDLELAEQMLSGGNS